MALRADVGAEGVTASPHNLFSYQEPAAGLSVYRVLALMPPDEGRITLSQLLDRVREKAAA